MVIISGNVLTDDGVMPIEDIKVGTKVIDRTQRAREVTKITEKAVKKVLKIKNANFTVSADTVINTLYGSFTFPHKDNTFKIKLNGIGKEVADSLEIVEGNFIGYELTIDGTTEVIVNRYSIKDKEG